MQNPPRKQLLRRLWIFVVTSCANISREDNFSDFFAVFGDVDEGACRLEVGGFDDAGLGARDEAVALPGHFGVHGGGGDVVPFGEEVGFGDGAVAVG